MNLFMNLSENQDYFGCMCFYNRLTVNFLWCRMRALRMVWIWEEITDNTEASIRLNSSKQPQAPHWARPEKILPIAWTKQEIKEKKASNKWKLKKTTECLICPTESAQVSTNIQVFTSTLVILLKWMQVCSRRHNMSTHAWWSETQRCSDTWLRLSMYETFVFYSKNEV